MALFKTRGTHKIATKERMASVANGSHVLCWLEKTSSGAERHTRQTTPWVIVPRRLDWNEEDRNNPRYGFLHLNQIS